jgi:predicted peptidase
MNGVQKILICLLLLTSACEKHDEITPIPPVSRHPAVPAEENPSKEDESSLDFTSGLYQYGKFEEMPYRVLVPRDYDQEKSYPLHIFLHGMDERGTDNEKQLSAIAKKFQVDSIRQNYPAFIIFPQCPSSLYWFDKPATQVLKGLIDSFVKNNHVDPEKISIGGFSMGAYGTFAMVAENPGFFQNAVAISGDGDENKAPSMATTGWQIFAGKKDDVVPSSKTERMATALRDAGASVAFKIFPEADHGGTWPKAFAEHNFFSLLFSREKVSAAAN